MLNIHPDIRERLERVFCLGEIGTCSEELWPLARVFVALRKTVLTSQDIINGFEMAQEGKCGIIIVFKMLCFVLFV